MKELFSFYSIEINVLIIMLGTTVYKDEYHRVYGKGVIP